MPFAPNDAITDDWSQFDPTAYLEEYYADLGDENLALLRFLSDTYAALPKGGVLLDFGGGPTIYPLISAVTRVDEVHLSDYLPANLDEVRRWLDRDPLAFDWDPFIEQVLEIETGRPGSPEAVEERAHRIRGRVTRLLSCDASRSPPLDSEAAPYDVVQTNFCAESATAHSETWRQFMANILSLLKPGGWLVMSALRGASCYAVGSRHFPAVEIYEDDLLELFTRSGLQADEARIQVIPADRETRDYAGLIVAVARKAPAADGVQP